MEREREAVNKKLMITADAARDMLTYDPETGILRWKRFANSCATAGEEAGVVCKSRGYRRIGIGKRVYQAHRLAWLIVHGVWPRRFLDHANGNRADNRLSNLREATDRQNQANRGRNRNNTSGYKGVYREKSDRWTARIRVGGKLLYLGRFDDPAEAGVAYAKAASSYFGDFAKE